MIGIGTALVSMGIGFVKDLIMDNGEDLVKEGIKKVTGIDLTKKKPEDLTPMEIQRINDSKLEISKLDFQKLQLELDKTKEANRAVEARFDKSNTIFFFTNSPTSMFVL